MKRLRATLDYLLLMLPIMVTCSFGFSQLRRTQRQHLLSSGFREDLAALPCLEPSSSMDLSSQQQMRMMYWQELQAILTHGQESIMSSTLTTQLEQVSLIQWFKERLQCFLCSLYYILIILHRLIGIWFLKFSGYSFSDKLPTTNDDVTDNLYECLQQWFKLFPEYQGNPFYAFGESYAGKFVPAITRRIHEQNEAGNADLIQWVASKYTLKIHKYFILESTLVDLELEMDGCPLTIMEDMLTSYTKLVFLMPSREMSVWPMRQRHRD